MGENFKVKLKISSVTKCEIITSIIHAFIIHCDDDNCVLKKHQIQDHKNYIYANQCLGIQQNKNAFPVSHLLGQVSWNTAMNMNELYI